MGTAVEEGAAAQPRPWLLRRRFQVIVQPEARLNLALLAAERLTVTGPACALEVLRIAPKTHGSSGGGVVLVWLHEFSNWLARIAPNAPGTQSAKARNQESYDGRLQVDHRHAEEARH